MKKSWIAALCVVVGLLIAVPVLNALIPENRIENTTDYQHEANSDADPTLGEATIPEDYILDDSFTTHLPLVIIDLQGNKIPNVYRFSNDGTSKVYTEEGLANPDPWVGMTISIVNNANNENHLTDEPELVNNGKIKLRGMTSRTFEKKQYGIKLMDGDVELETSVLGMEADEDWVLSNSILDLSGIRNYLAMNIGRQIMPFTSEVRFCEVVFKDGDTYTYQGLYLMQESVKQAEGRINITDYDEDAVSLSYVLCRDRYDETSLTLSTWASDEQICYGYFGVVYPKEELLTQEAIDTIEAEISRIEYALYSDDPAEFLKYRDYIDVDSFVDYYIINEFFMNYDAGNNSTYYYKNSEGKLAIGPLWDYDNCLDNYIYDVANLEYSSFANQPWFERLLLDEVFQEKIITRYEELRESVLNKEYINTFIDESFQYLGNARARDYMRWKEVYENQHLLQDLENYEGIVIDRNAGTPEDEVQRVKDNITIHGNWMDEELEEGLSIRGSKDITEQDEFDPTGIAVIGILAFIAMMIVLLRLVKGEYR